MRSRQDTDELAAGTGPGKAVFRVASAVIGIVLVTVLATLALRAFGNVTGGWRIAVAVAMAVGIAWLGIGYFRYLTHPPPPDPAPLDVDPQLRLSYLCEMCGLELAVVAVAKEKAPRHCGEAMSLIRRDERY